MVSVLTRYVLGLEGGVLTVFMLHSIMHFLVAIPCQVSGPIKCGMVSARYLDSDVWLISSLLTDRDLKVNPATYLVLATYQDALTIDQHCEIQKYDLTFTDSANIIWFD